MEQLAADVAIGGDIKNVVHREDFTWPEIILMRDIHGEASVTNVEVVGESPLDPRDEIERLRVAYGRKFVRVYGRHADSVPLHPPAHIPRFDDEVEIQVRTRRPLADPNPAGAQTETERRAAKLGSMGKLEENPQPRFRRDETQHDAPPTYQAPQQLGEGDEPEQQGDQDLAPEQLSVHARRQKLANQGPIPAKPGA